MWNKVYEVVGEQRSWFLCNYLVMVAIYIYRFHLKKQSS